MRPLRVGLLFTALMSGSVVGAEEVDVESLLDATDDITRGASSVAVMSMHVKTARYERTMKMKVWSQGEERSLIRILEPAKERGMVTLKVDDNVWNYLPKIDRTMKVTAGMMSSGWMGSHITNDDLVKQNRLADDFTWEVVYQPDDSHDHYRIALTPKPDAPIVWGRVDVDVRPDKVPLAIRYFDEDESLVRTLLFDKLTEVSGRIIPMEMRVTPEKKDGEFTAITYDELDFDTPVPDSTFSLQALRQ